MLLNRVIKRRPKLRPAKHVSHNSTFRRHKMQSKTHYNILCVKNNASQADIKAAYYKLCMRYHPDVNKSEESIEIFKEINQAYKVLSNQTFRKSYDRELYLSHRDATNYFKYRYTSPTPYSNVYTMATPSYTRETIKSSMPRSIMNYMYKQQAIMKLYDGNDEPNKPANFGNKTMRYIFGITCMLLTAFLTTVTHGQYDVNTQKLSQKESRNNRLFEDLPRH